MNNKVRVYDLAKKLKKSNKELLAVLQELGVTVKSHSSSIDEETAQAVENILAESSPAQKNLPNLHSTKTLTRNPDRSRHIQIHRGRIRIRAGSRISSRGRIRIRDRIRIRADRRIRISKDSPRIKISLSRRVSLLRHSLSPKPQSRKSC